MVPFFFFKELPPSLKSNFAFQGCRIMSCYGFLDKPPAPGRSLHPASQFCFMGGQRDSFRVWPPPLWPLVLWISCYSSLHAKYAVSSPVTLIASLFSELAAGSLVVSSFFSHLCYLKDLHKYPKALCCWICYIRDSDLWILKTILIPETCQSRVRALAVRPFPAGSLMSCCPPVHVCESDEYNTVEMYSLASAMWQ